MEDLKQSSVLQDKEYLTTTDLVEYLGVTRQAIQQFRELRRDPLPYYKVEYHIRFSYWDVRAWVERRKVKRYNPGAVK